MAASLNVSSARVAPRSVMRAAATSSITSSTVVAVERTAPMSFVLYTLSILWFHQTGHRKVKYPERPWYKHKTTPSFADILCTLRRESFMGWFSRVPCRDRRVRKQVARLVDLLGLSG